MKTMKRKMSGAARPRALRILTSILASGSLLVCSQLAAYATTISADSTTILRMREGTLGDHLFPLYEYLHVSATDAGSQGAVSVHLGGWGRVDLGDKSTDERLEGDIQYGFVSYQSNRNNLILNAGRQFVVEGVATERVDGLYMRSDLAAGFTTAAFIGAPVVTEPNFDGGEVIYGGRLAHTLPKYYSLGVSALRNEMNGDGLREEEGIDLWLRPTAQIDLTGRSSYNSLSNGWMEHAYTLTFAPTDAIRVSALLQQINYDDYFYHVTTSALALTDGLLQPGEDVWKLGASVGFNPGKNFGVTGEYQRFEYDIAGSANYYGARAGFATANAFAAGLSVHRMDGDADELQYNQFRAWASQKFGPADVSLDLFDVYYDSSINGRKNTWSLAAAAGYDFNPSLRVVADVDYVRSTDFDHELRGLVKVSYAFGFGKEGKE